MNRIKIGELIKIKERPETTLLLKAAISNPAKTVDSYIFTESIHDYFTRILEKVSKGSGGGFWIQAEYGAGKTHFLATLASLLLNQDDVVWGKVHDEEIRNYQKRLRNNNLFPVIFSLRGEAGVEGEEDLLGVIEKRLEESLEEKGIRDRVEITTIDEIYQWYEKEASSNLKNTINEYIWQKTSKKAMELDKQTIVHLIKQYCAENRIKPEITMTTKERITHIYNQLKAIGYNGMLFVIDEFASWQIRHTPNTKEYARDEEVLETLSWELPKSLHLNIYTIVASQMPPPTKLIGERFERFELLAGNRAYEYDKIVSKRVREIIEEKKPEIDQYYEFYRKEFDFLKGIDREYFYDVFPFQPKCFEAVRKITAKELPTARSGIHVIYDVITDSDITARNTLVTVSDLMISPSLAQDLRSAHVYKEHFTFYKNALDGLMELELDNEDREVAERIIKTLFLWHIAHIDSPRHLTVKELTEMTLTTSDILRGHDIIESILIKLRGDIPQISYTKEKGAIFVSQPLEVRPARIFSETKKKITDRTIIQKGWEKALVLSMIETKGQQTLFSGYKLDERKDVEVDFKKIEYDGEVILATNWRPDYGEPVKEGLHFRIIFLTNNTEVKPEELRDPRIAVCIPSELTDGAIEATRNYLTIQKMKEDYSEKSGSEAEEVLEWVKTKEDEVLRELIGKQLGIFKNGSIITQRSLGIDMKKVFSTDELEKIFGNIVSYLLSDAYTSMPFDPTAFKKKFSNRDARNVFEGFFKSEQEPRALSACDNYGLGLGLSRGEEPRKFNPDANKVFEILREKLKLGNGEIKLWKLYQELQAPPYGLTRELITLYLLSFVRYGDPSVEITLKMGHKLGIKTNKITSANIPEIEWRGKFYEDFETLSYSTEIHWNDVLQFAKIVNRDLKPATTHEEIIEQEKLLISTLSEISSKCEKIRQNLIALSEKYREKIDAQLKILSNVESISKSKSYREFYESIKNTYMENEETFYREDYAKYEKMRMVSDRSITLLTLKQYLDDAIIPEGDELVLKKGTLQSQLKLQSLIEKPETIEAIIGSFEQFKIAYINKYQIHHRDYYKKVEELRASASGISKKVQAINRLIALDIPLASIERIYEELPVLLKSCPSSDPVSVEASPLCNSCKITLLDSPPTSETEEYIQKINEIASDGMKKLSHVLTSQILEMDTEQRLSGLLNAINTNNSTLFADLLTEEMTSYLKELLEKAQIVSIQLPILSEFTKKYSYVDEQNFEEVVQTFKADIENALQKAKRENPGKKIRIVLK